MMIKDSRQVLSPMGKSVALTLLVIIAVPYLLLLVAVAEYLGFGTQHIVEFYRAIGIAEPLDWFGSNTIGRLTGS